MPNRTTPLLTLLAVLSVTSLAHAQSTTDTTMHMPMDSAHRELRRDARIVTRDTVKLNQYVATRDSARAALQLAQAKNDSDQTRLDSLKTDMDRARKATPRDTVAITRDEAAAKALQKTLDQDRNIAGRARKRVDLAQKAVKRESDAAIKEHQDIRSDHSKLQTSKDSSK